MHPLLPIFSLFLFTTAHMEMKIPPPFKSKFNPAAGSDIDYNMINPLSPNGSNFPCKSYESLLSTPAGASTATWAHGTTQTVILTGSAIHNGGSCQFSISYDAGTTWHVIHSIIGSCPSAPGDSSYDIPIPANVPSSPDVLFAWTWYNKIGNREVYGNCAHITIEGGPSLDSGSSVLSSFPDIFRANMGDGCQVPEGIDVVFPDPGPDPLYNSAGTPPVSGCGGSSEPSGASASDKSALVNSSDLQQDQEAEITENSKDFFVESGLESDIPVTAGENISAASTNDNDKTKHSNAGYKTGNYWPMWFSEGCMMRPCERALLAVVVLMVCMA